MNELEAVRALAPVAAAPTAAVLAAARQTAGLGTTELPTPDAASDAEPLVLTPRRPRRTRRRMVSLTVALASTGIAAAVAGAVVVAGGTHGTALSPAADPGANGGSPSADRPSGLVTPTDAQLGTARWFHVSTTEKTGSCPGIRQVWFSFSGIGGIYRLEDGTRADPCGPVDLPAAGPYFAEQPSSLSGLQGLKPTTKQLAKTLGMFEHLADGDTSAEKYVNIIGESLTETPLPSLLRLELLSLMEHAPGVTSLDGTDSLGRPVRWLSAPAGSDGLRQWYGFDEVTYWLIASSHSPAGADGQPAGEEAVVTAIDTSAPTTIVETDAEQHPAPALTPSPSVVTPLIGVSQPPATSLLTPSP